MNETSMRMMKGSDTMETAIRAAMRLHMMTLGRAARCFSNILSAKMRVKNSCSVPVTMMVRK